MSEPTCAMLSGVPSVEICHARAGLPMVSLGLHNHARTCWSRQRVRPTVSAGGAGAGSSAQSGQLHMCFSLLR